MPQPPHDKAITPVYLGDGVYVSFAFGQLCLSTPQQEPQNEIMLEPEVWRALLKYVADSDPKVRAYLAG